MRQKYNTYRMRSNLACFFAYIENYYRALGSSQVALHCKSHKKLTKLNHESTKRLQGTGGSCDQSTHGRPPYIKTF